MSKGRPDSELYQSIEHHELAESILSRQNPRIYPKLFVQFKPGDCFLPKEYSNYYNYIKNLPVREDDVWVVSFIKAGTTWVQEMVWIIGHDMDYECAKVPVTLRFPFLEIEAVLNADLIDKQDQGKPKTLEILEKMDSPRFIKSHLPLTLLPTQLGTGKTPKIIYVARNPKDVCTSYYHHRVLIEGYLGTLDDMVEEFVADLSFFAPFWSHVKQFWERRHEPNVLFITYEEMIKDLGSVVRRTAKFLEKTLTEVELERLAQHLSFESMRQNPYVNYAEVSEHVIRVHGVDRKTDFIRKGQVGSWKEELSPESIQKLDDWICKNRIPGLWDDVL